MPKNDGKWRDYNRNGGGGGRNNRNFDSMDAVDKFVFREEQHEKMGKYLGRLAESHKRDSSVGKDDEPITNGTAKKLLKSMDDIANGQFRSPGCAQSSGGAGFERTAAASSARAPACGPGWHHEPRLLLPSGHTRQLSSAARAGMRRQ